MADSAPARRHEALVAFRAPGRVASRVWPRFCTLGARVLPILATYFHRLNHPLVGAIRLSDALASTPVSSFESAAGSRAAAAAADSGESDTEYGDSDGSGHEGIDGVGADESTGGPELSESLSSSRSVRERSNRIVSTVAYDAKMLTAQEDLVDFSALDRDEVPVWVEALEEARRSLGALHTPASTGGCRWIPLSACRRLRRSASTRCVFRLSARRSGRSTRPRPTISPPASISTASVSLSSAAWTMSTGSSTVSIACTPFSTPGTRSPPTRSSVRSIGGLDLSEMAGMFLGRNHSSPVTAYERFGVAVTAGYSPEVEIEKIVLSAGLKVGYSAKGNVFSVAALGRVYRRNGPEILQRVLLVLRDAYKSMPDAFSGRLLDGLAMVLVTYSRIDDKLLVRALGSDPHGVYGLQRGAEHYRARLGRPVPECVAASAVDIYNERAGRKRRLLKWWKAHKGGRLRRARRS